MSVDHRRLLGARGGSEGRWLSGFTKPKGKFWKRKFNRASRKDMECPGRGGSRRMGGWFWWS